MAVTLDKSRPFGTITPLYLGAAFEQNGRFFAPDGTRVLLPGEAPEAVKAAPGPSQPAAVPAEPAKRPQGRPKGSKNAPKDPPAVASEPVKSDPVTEGDVNLTAWAKGEAEYIMADIYKAIRTRYSRIVATEADAVDTLVDEGAVAAEDVKRI